MSRNWSCSGHSPRGGRFFTGGDFIRIKPLTLATANAFIKAHHRHHGGAAGYKFAIGLINDIGDLCGVVVVGRPVARHYDDGYTAEVTRMCTDGMKNACSFLYAACSRIAKHMGYERIITYILASERGTSLKASNWTNNGVCSGNSCDSLSRPRPNNGKKVMYSKNLCKKL